MAFNPNEGRNEYKASASQTVFSFNFKIYASTDLVAYQVPTGTTPDDTQNVLTEITDYTVTIDGDNGGSITLVTGAPLDDNITLVRDLTIARQVEYQELGDFYADSINLDQDYQTYLTMDQASIANRHISIPVSSQGVSTQLPDVSPDSYLVWNSAGDALVNDSTIPESVAITQANKDAAALSESNASASETASANSANASAISATASADSAAEAALSATQIPSKTSARNSVISAVNGVNALATTPTPSHIDIAYTGNGTAQDVVTGLPSVSRPWVASASYTIGDYKTHDYVIYEALTTHTGVATTPDADTTNWQPITDGVHLDADNADIWIKQRTPTIRSNYRMDTLRGADKHTITDTTAAEVTSTTLINSFNVDGFSVGTSHAVNENLGTYVAWTEYFDKMFSFTTNHGKRGICAYNAQSGKFMVSYQGSGIAGHEIPHGVGTKPDFLVVKDRDTIISWITYDSVKGADNYMYLDQNVQSQTETSVWNGTEPTDLVYTLGTNTTSNNLNKNFIAYGSSNRKNHSYVGSYVGTGVAGNEVDVGMDLLALDTAGKNIKVMIKGLNGVAEWLLLDNTRVSGTLDGLLRASLSDAELLSADRIEYTNNGIIIKLGSGAQINDDGIQYLIEATAEDFDNPNGGLDLNPSRISFADGSNATGDADLTATTIAPATYPMIAGTKNYFYTGFVDADSVTLGSTDVKLLEGLNRVDADKWGVVSPSDATLKTTDKHSDYASATGVASASSEFDANYKAYEAFDKSNATANTWISLTGDTVGAELRYSFSEKRIPKSIEYKHWINASRGDITEGSIFGTNDNGATWTLIKSFTGVVSASGGSSGLIDLTNSLGYEAMKLVVDAYTDVGVVNYVCIAEMIINTEHPSGDFYNVAEGVMYSPSEMITNGTFDTDTTGWDSTNATTQTHDTTIFTNGGIKSVSVAGGSGNGESQILNGFVIGEDYTLKADVYCPSTNTATNVAGIGISFLVSEGVSVTTEDTVNNLEFTFTATSTTHTINLFLLNYGVEWGATGDTAFFDNVSVIDKFGEPIKRVYTAEADVDLSGEIIPDTWVDRAVKNQNLTDVTVHGDAEFLGGFDLGQSLADIAAQRILGAEYKNETGKPITVFVSVVGTTAGVGTTAYIDGISLLNGFASTTQRCNFTLQVPSNSTYAISNISVTLTTWVELI